MKNIQMTLARHLCWAEPYHKRHLAPKVPWRQDNTINQTILENKDSDIDRRKNLTHMNEPITITGDLGGWIIQTHIVIDCFVWLAQ